MCESGKNFHLERKRHGLKLFMANRRLCKDGRLEGPELSRSFTMILCALKLQQILRLLTSVGFFPKTASDTFRSVPIYGKEQESRKTFHTCAKKDLPS